MRVFFIVARPAFFVVLGLSTIVSPARADDAHPSALRTPPAPGPVPVEPADYRMDDYRKPVPATLKGATVVDTLKAEKLLETKAAIFIDVFPKPPKPSNLPAGTLWIDPKHDTIEGALWIPNVGYGAAPSGVDDYFRANLTRLTAANPGKPLLFFCLRDCWMSWNAAKRALEWGYRDVLWYPEGTDGWQEAGNDLVSVASEK